MIGLELNTEMKGIILTGNNGKEERWIKKKDNVGLKKKSKYLMHMGEKSKAVKRCEMKLKKSLAYDFPLSYINEETNKSQNSKITVAVLLVLR